MLRTVGRRHADSIQHWIGLNPQVESQIEAAVTASLWKRDRKQARGSSASLGSLLIVQELSQWDPAFAGNLAHAIRFLQHGLEAVERLDVSLSLQSFHLCFEELQFCQLRLRKKRAVASRVTSFSEEVASEGVLLKLEQVIRSLRFSCERGLRFASVGGEGELAEAYEVLEEAVAAVSKLSTAFS